MPVRPTDRKPSSKLAILNARLSKTMNNSAVLAPVSLGVNNLARKAIFQALKHLQFGRLTLIEDFDKAIPNTQTFGNLSDNATNSHNTSSSAVGRHALQVTLTIHDISVYRQLLFGGSIALADSYINGEWDTDDLTGLIRFLQLL